MENLEKQVLIKQIKMDGQVRVIMTNIQMRINKQVNNNKCKSNRLVKLKEKRKEKSLRRNSWI